MRRSWASRSPLFSMFSMKRCLSRSLLSLLSDMNTSAPRCGLYTKESSEKHAPKIDTFGSKLDGSLKTQ